jgi:hypothetical protein
MCLYDLQKAYDSVEYPVLLKRLFDVGVNGKLWRLMRNWYSGGHCVVRDTLAGIVWGEVAFSCAFVAGYGPVIEESTGV